MVVHTCNLSTWAEQSTCTKQKSLKEREEGGPALHQWQEAERWLWPGMKEEG
jgi:hypothetical protein